MKKKSFQILVILVFLAMAGRAQSRKSSNKLFKEIASGLKGDFSRLDDSISFLSFTLEVKFKNEIGIPRISAIVVNDSLGMKFLDNHDFIKFLNFSSIIGKDKVSSVFIPVLLLRFHSNEKALISILPRQQFNNGILNIFNDQARWSGFSNRKYFTKPFIIYEDKTIFN